MLGLLIFILILSILIVVHEFGHFLAARRAGVKVERFSIGFGPPLVKIKGKETQFLICLFPLGGYVKLAGDSRTDRKGLNYEFLSKPVGVRARIVFFGPLFNYLLAIVIFWIAFMVGFPYPDTFVGKVLDDYPAAQAGIQEGDKIVQINDKKVDNWMEVTELISSSKGEVNLTIERDRKILKLAIDPSEKELKDIFGQKIKRRVVGIMSSDKVKVIRENLFSAFLKSVERTIALTFLIVKGFVYTILGILPAKEAIAGPIGIYHYTSEAAKIGLNAVLVLMGTLSVSLTIINLVPFPVLDGGHIFFLFLEKMRKRPLSEKVEEIVVRVGMAALFLLIGIVLYNDILRFVIGK